MKNYQITLFVLISLNGKTTGGYGYTRRRPTSHNRRQTPYGEYIVNSRKYSNKHGKRLTPLETVRPFCDRPLHSKIKKIRLLAHFTALKSTVPFRVIRTHPRSPRVTKGQKSKIFKIRQMTYQIEGNCTWGNPIGESNSTIYDPTRGPPWSRKVKKQNRSNDLPNGSKFHGDP